MIEFTRSTGDTVMVNPSDVKTIETTPTYTVLQSEVRTNPGEVLTKVVYNNPRMDTNLPESAQGRIMMEEGEFMDNLDPAFEDMEETDTDLECLESLHFMVEEATLLHRVLSLGETCDYNLLLIAAKEYKHSAEQEPFSRKLQTSVL